VSRAIHVQSMKVETGALVAQGVLNVDNDLITFGRNDRRDWPLPVDTDDRAIVLTVRVGVCPTYVEVVCDRSTMSRRQKKG
jgi:hypothetical protein